MLLATALLVPGAGPAQAHPHEFIDATLDLVFAADGTLTEIGVEWRYDAFTSMLILSDMGLNPAADALSDEERAMLEGFDLQWQPGYDGDLWPVQGDTPVPLGPPRGGAVTLIDGQLITRHSRPVLAPVDPADPVAGPLVIQVYDPEYYVAYTIAATGAGREDCRARIFVPDRASAQAQLEAALDELFAGGVDDIESAFPAVGRDFAEEIRIDCTPGQP
ncbi:MAG: DUF1007 family protein [Pararhodobacter sp.]